MTRVYGPAEDSMLLLRNIEGRVYGSVLDMGTGSGIHAITAAREIRVTRVVAVDIDPEAVELTRKRAEEQGVSERIEFRVGDLFEGLEGMLFDWILFNPPYLPSDGTVDEASWSGGESGIEVIEKFLREAISHLMPSGAILMVYSSQTGLDIEAVEMDYVVEVLEDFPLFFEVLYCLLLRPFSPSVGPGRNRL
jgi:release factor glutamine methyltransferase